MTRSDHRAAHPCAPVSHRQAVVGHAHLVTSAAHLKEAVEAVGGATWALLLADPGPIDLRGSGMGNHRRLAAFSGSSKLEAHVVAGNVTFGSVLEASEALGLPCVFYDGTSFNGGVAIVDLGIIAVAASAYTAVLSAVEEELGTTLVLTEHRP